MFEPEYQGLICLTCGSRKVYFDREMGYYCMLCGQQFGTEETHGPAKGVVSQIPAPGTPTRADLD